MSSMSPPAIRRPCRKQLRRPEPIVAKPGQYPELKGQYPDLYNTFSLLEELEDTAEFTKAARDFVLAYKLCWNVIVDSAKSVKALDCAALLHNKESATTACEDVLRHMQGAKHSLGVIRRELAALEDHYRLVMYAVCKNKPLPELPDSEGSDEGSDSLYFDALSDMDGVRYSVIILPPESPRSQAKINSVSTASTITIPSIFSRSSHAKNSSVSSSSTAHTDPGNGPLPLELVFNALFEEQQELHKQRLEEEPAPEPEKPINSLYRLKQKIASSTLSLTGISGKVLKDTKGPSKGVSSRQKTGSSPSSGAEEELDSFEEAYCETVYSDSGDRDRQAKRGNSDLLIYSIVLDTDGNAQWATVQALVCMVTASDYCNNLLIHTLLSGFRRLVGPLDFLAFLRHRYQKSYTYRVRVAKLLLLWAQHHWERQDMVVLGPAVTFVANMEMDDTVPKGLIGHLRNALDNPRLGNQFPSRSQISEQRMQPFLPIDILAISSDDRKDVAHKITAIASEMYKRVDKSLLIRYWMASKTEKQRLAMEGRDSWKLTEVLAIPAFEEALAKWVSFAITKGMDISTRAEHISFWLEVAKHCWELCNFSSASRIFGGVAASCISSMKETVLRVGEHHKIIYHELEWNLSSVKNYASYRTALKAARDQNRPLVPLSDCLVHDISMGVEKHKQVRASTGSRSSNVVLEIPSRRTVALDTADMIDVSHTNIESVKQVYECLSGIQPYGLEMGWDEDWQRWFMTHLLKFGDLSSHYPRFEDELLEAARREPKSPNGLDSEGRPFPTCEAPKLWNYILDKNVYVDIRTWDNYPGSRVGRRPSISRRAKSVARSVKGSINAVREAGQLHSIAIAKKLSSLDT